jgi:hypothetical protein
MMYAVEIDGEPMISFSRSEDALKYVYKLQGSHEITIIPYCPAMAFFAYPGTGKPEDVER